MIYDNTGRTTSLENLSKKSHHLNNTAVYYDVFTSSYFQYLLLMEEKV